ncbi:MAG: Phosphoglucosamine mutase [Alphaproteobacteria bacterium MarineAlpha2_Bin1]|nr:MAG: Phosphoglucosamine mutase [Alphaproteobacteria bacterium MarineAlpha2_Bin1]
MIKINKKHFFGTDGIRGEANKFPMTPEIILKLGMSIGSYFANDHRRNTVLIGKDTRLSGYMLESALVSGFTSVGSDVILVGPMPTPAVAMLTQCLQANLGLVISASHNLYKDNGIKIFGPDGYKISDKDEVEIEKRIIKGVKLSYPNKVGRARRLEGEIGKYAENLKLNFKSKGTLSGIKIVIDCANGAAYKIAPAVLRELGAIVISINDNPDGININDQCGSTYPKQMVQKVLEQRADIGFSLDGDADRLVVSDEKGNLVDGDNLIGAIVNYLKSTNKLKKNHVVTTSMSNMGLELYLKKIGVNLLRSKVGDKYVLEEMIKNDANFGAEKSGHIIFLDNSTTGDGLLAAIKLLLIMLHENKKPSEIFHPFKLFPQILKNIDSSTLNSIDSEIVQKTIKDHNKRLGSSGRIIVRQSGTEPLIRIMAEGNDPKSIKYAIDSIEKSFSKS